MDADEIVGTPRICIVYPCLQTGGVGRTQRRSRRRARQSHLIIAALAEQLCAGKPGVMLRFLPCQRQCGKGPNIKWDGKLYNRADEKLLRQLLENA